MNLGEGWFTAHAPGNVKNPQLIPSEFMVENPSTLREMLEYIAT